MFLSLILLVLVITWGQALEWGSPAIIALSILFAVFLAGFVIVEKRADQPMVELSLFRNRPFSASNASGFLSFVAISGAVFTSALQSNQAAGLVYEAAFLGGFHDAFMVAAVVCSVGVITSLMRGKRGKIA